MPLFAVLRCQSQSVITTLKPSTYSWLVVISAAAITFCSFLSHKLCRHSLRSQAFITFSIACLHTQVGGKAISPPRPLNLGHDAAGWGDAQFAPALECYTHFKHNRESCGNFLQFPVLPLASFTQLFVVNVLDYQICLQQMVAASL